MNNRIFRHSGIILAAAVFCFSCGLKINIDEETSLTARPDVMVSDSNGFIISTKLYTENTDYINVYRQDVTDDRNPGEIINIGVFFPEKINSSNKTYQFQDLDIFNDHKYKYKMRYHDSVNKEYKYSAWSETITTDSKGVAETTEIFYTFDDDAFFAYESSDKTLLLTDGSTSGTSLITSEPDVKRPTTEFSLYPTLIFEKTNEDKTKERLAVELNANALNSEIHLISYLPNSFWNTDISLVGIMAAQKGIVTDEEGNVTVQYIYWTKYTEIPVKVYNTEDSEYVEQTTIKVDTTGAANTQDYSNPK